MTDVYNQELRGMPRERGLGQGEERNDQVAKGEGSTSASGGFSFYVSSKNVAGVVTALTVVTPFIVLFSPVLLSVFVVVFLLATGYFTAREFGGAAKTGLSRMYEYVTDSNKNRVREDSFDWETNKISLKNREETPSERFRYQNRGGFDNATEGEESSHNLMKAATAATTGSSLVFFSGLTFIGTVIALVLATPPLLIFSPVLVPALITAVVLATGFVSSGGFGVAAATVLAWTYKYATEGGQTSISNMFTSNRRESSNEETGMFGSRPQESRSEETRMFGSKSQEQGEKLDRDEYRTRGVHETDQNQGGGNYLVAKAASATTFGGSMFVLSGLTFVGTVIGLTVATPVMVIFSPVLVPAVITMFLLTSGLFASGGFSVAAVTTSGWLYKYVTKEQQNNTNFLDWGSRNQGFSYESSRDTGLGEEDTQGAKTQTRDRRDLLREIDAFEEGTQGEKTREQGRRNVRYSNETGKGYNQMVVKAATATTAGGSFLVFSGLTFVGTVIALTMATPLLVLFSPVIVPALIAMSLLATGFVASGGFGVAGTTVLAWLYRYATSGQHTLESESYDNTMNTMDLTGRERTPMSDQAIRTSHRETGDAKYTSGDEKGDNKQVMVKAATAATTGGSMLVFSGLTFAGTVIALTVATPLFVIFSPVLVPALITMFLLPTGFLTSGGLGVAGTTVLSKIYKSVTSGNRMREDSFDQGTHKMGSKGYDQTRDMGEFGIGIGIGEGHHVTNRDRVNPASHLKV